MFDIISVKKESKRIFGNKKKDYMSDDKKEVVNQMKLFHFSKLGPVPAVPVPVGQEGNAFDQVFHHLSPFLDFCQNDTNEWQ